MKKALVIGGSGSIGSAIVKQLLADHYEVIVHYHRANIEQLKKLYEGEAVEFVQADLSQSLDIATIFGHIKHLDCLIYASGQALYGMLQDMTQRDLDQCYHLNVRQLILISQYFIDILRQSEHGRIIAISSIWGETGASMETIYSTMKSAQIGFVKALSQELALTTVTVNAIAPGFVSGHMAKHWSQEELELILEELPQHRMVQPEEIAHTCAYLCHPNAKSITGTVQKVNGGWYI